MLVAGQRMADEHEVRLGGIKLAISLIGDRKLRELAPAVERQLLVEMNDMALRIGDLRQPHRTVGDGLRRRGLAHVTSARSGSLPAKPLFTQFGVS